VTISEHSKQELVEWFRIPEHRISITPLGVNRRWFSKPSPDELQSASKKYGLPEQYLLFVGTLQPRKNVGRLITAHRMLSESMRRDFPLVVVGRAGWGCEEVVKMLIEGDRNRILWLNYLPGEDLLPLVQLATALVFPSLHEGFGLPVLEAFAAGVPVITSNTTALPEVAGQAALLVDPESTSDIADAMRMLVTDDALSRKLRSLGRERAKWFSWERTVKKTVAVYQKARSAF
jgi:alpha-1,3-rhamnosyl/mannosyltransferase